MFPSKSRMGVQQEKLSLLFAVQSIRAADLRNESRAKAPSKSN
jgi:hypothetical protein